MVKTNVAMQNTQMGLPTFSKLAAALVLAGTGYVAGTEIALHLPDGTRGGEALAPIAGSFGLLMGWRVVGVYPGRNWMAAISDGLRGMIYMMLIAYFYLGAAQMLKLALRRYYDGVIAALSDIVIQALVLVQASIGTSVILTLLLGGLISGIASEWAHRRFGRRA